MKKILLANGGYAIVDNEDYPYLSRFRWIFNGGVFATLLREKMRYVLVPMGYFLLKPQWHRNVVISHKNNNILDFRKSNLMWIGDSKKMQRGKKRRTHFGKQCTSKYKGVSKREGRSHPWTAQINQDKKCFWLGAFEKEKEAAIVYNEKAKELYGEFAYQNIIK